MVANSPQLIVESEQYVVSINVYGSLLKKPLIVVLELPVLFFGEGRRICEGDVTWSLQRCQESGSDFEPRLVFLDQLRLVRLGLVEDRRERPLEGPQVVLDFQQSAAQYLF